MIEMTSLDVLASNVFAPVDMTFGMCLSCHRDQGILYKMLEQKIEKGRGGTCSEQHAALGETGNRCFCMYNRRKDGSSNGSRMERTSVRIEALTGILIDWGTRWDIKR